MSNINSNSSNSSNSSNDHETTNNVCDEFTITWETQTALKIKQHLKSKSTHTKPLLVGIVGIPGSGKSTSSQILSSILSSTHGVTNVIMPMDGYHHPLSVLKAMPTASDLIYRRGAPDTFDPSSLKRDLERIIAAGSNYCSIDHENKDKSNSDSLRNNKDGNTVMIPGFDHAKGDPEENVYTYNPSIHQVVICEGLYLLHDSNGWENIGNMFDLKIFIKADVDACVDRLKIRNLCIPGYTKEEIEVRCEAVDRVNAMTVLRSMERADIVVESIAASQTL